MFGAHFVRFGTLPVIITCNSPIHIKASSMSTLQLAEQGHGAEGKERLWSYITTRHENIETKITQTENEASFWFNLHISVVVAVIGALIAIYNEANIDPLRNCTASSLVEDTKSFGDAYRFYMLMELLIGFACLFQILMFIKHTSLATTIYFHSQQLSAIRKVVQKKQFEENELLRLVGKLGRSMDTYVCVHNSLQTIGIQQDFPTLLFIIINTAFVVFLPLL